MKKVLLYVFMAAVSIGMQSCLHDNDEVFDRSAADRIDETLAETGQLLESAEYGWVLHYYMGAEYAFGSMNITIKFQNGKVAMSQEGYTDTTGEYVTETSTYKLTRDQGPVLAFDTYNDILHYYGDPAGSQAPTDVEGFQADYEFVIMNISDDQNTITLKGKKYGNKMLLERLQKPASTYLDDAAEVGEALSSAGTLNYIDGSFSAKVVIGSSYVTFRYTDADGKQTLDVPYTFTDNGLLFNLPIELNDNTISGISYVANSETFPLIDTKSQSVAISYDPVDVFQAGNWYIAASNLGEVAAKGFKSFTDACLNNEGENVDYCYIGTYSAGGYGFCFMSGGRYRGLEVFDVETEGTDVITFSFGGSVSNGTWYRNNDNLADATTPFYNTFKLTGNDTKAPTEFTLTDVNDAANTIKLVKEEITFPADN